MCFANASLENVTSEGVTSVVKISAISGFAITNHVFNSMAVKPNSFATVTGDS